MGTLSEVATMTAENTVSSKKLRLKILAKKPVNGVPEFSRAPEVKKPPSMDKLKPHLGSGHVTQGCQKSSVTTQNQMTAVIGDTKLNSIAGCKRRPEEVLECHERKRLKMNHSTTANCHQVLTLLMNHERSFPFHAPVKPDVWGNIDDYFDIVKNPMDLGTIKQKLQQKTYSVIEEFEADVRLTFSNAMLYNPPHNWVHEAAKELNMVFDRLWKPVKMRMCREHKDVKQRGLDSSQDKITYDVKPKCSDTGQLFRKAMLRKEKASEDLKKHSVSGKQRSDLKVAKPRDGKPKATLCSVDKEHDFAGFASTTGSLGATTAKDLGTVVDVKLSPSKALRVARLKSRYADIILKAQHHTLFEQDGETNAANWQQEKKKLDCRQQEEKAQIEAKIRAAESERKNQRQQAREAARMALAKMQRSVEFVDNLLVLRDLEAMVGSSLVVMCHDRRPRATMWSQTESDKLRSPLEQLGLYIKEEYRVGDDDDFDLEEGEIII